MAPRENAAARVAAGAALVLGSLVPSPARAQIDEIQVYTGEINKPGEFSITLHDNYTVIGPKEPAFIGGIVPDHSLNGVPEYGLGITPWLELGAYLPLYSVTRDGRFLIDGGKLRALFVLPNAAERAFWYGVNFELSYNARHWQEARYAAEVRPNPRLAFWTCRSPPQPDRGSAVSRRAGGADVCSGGAGRLQFLRDLGARGRALR